VVEVQNPVAGGIASGADVVQAFEQWHQPVEILQTDDVAIAQFARPSSYHGTG